MIQQTTEATIIQYLLTLVEQIKKGGDLQCQPHGITIQQWLIMLQLANDPNMPFSRQRRPGDPVLASELADFSRVSRPNITNMLTPLLERNYIKQVTDEKDRRKKILLLTEEGKAVLAALETVRLPANERLFSNFSPDERKYFLSYLLRCVSHLSRVLGE